MTAVHKPSFALTLETPLGRMTLMEEGGAITSLCWVASGDERPSALLRRAGCLLERYFAGQPVAFDLPLEPVGTAFERGVWTALRAIPWGEIRRYGDIARESGGSPRAVGQAVGRNPIPIMIPCHRVIAARGLGGFSAPGGVATKRALLALEGSVAADDLFADGCWRMWRERKSEAMA